MAKLLVDVFERIVVPVTALPGPEEGEPSTEMFALEALGRVLVTSLRMWAQTGPDTAEGTARSVAEFVLQFLTDDHEDVAEVLRQLEAVEWARPSPPRLSVIRNAAAVPVTSKKRRTPTYSGPLRIGASLLPGAGSGRRAGRVGRGSPRSRRPRDRRPYASYRLPRPRRGPGPGRGRMFDYLPDHAINPVTEHAWQSAPNYAADEEENFTIGVHAADTAPHIAEAAWRPLAQHVASAAFNLGLLLSETGRSEEAQEMYRQAVAAGNTDAAVNLGVLLSRAGRNEEAEQMYRQAADAGNTDAAVNLGVLLARLGRNEEAEEVYRRGADTGDTAAISNLGLLLAKLGHNEEAEQMYRQAAAAGHTNAAVNLGVLLDEAGRKEEAEKIYRQAVNAGNTTAGEKERNDIAPVIKPVPRKTR
ncbi:tetratricopeptide repeat protein [Streptomyces sp. NPDC002886]|uniref:tetratricopeptide repeat protein n=1 Tax=Streptomyces sp. NPDC002886 TaxID=3364667 RepID=UPI00367F0E54